MDAFFVLDKKQADTYTDITKQQQKSAEGGKKNCMFNNIGHKIQKLAKAFCWIGIVFWTIKGIDLIGSLSMTHQLTGSYVTASSAAGVLVSIVTIIVGVLVSWIGSLVLYAFGQLVEDTHAIRENTEAEEESTES